MGGNTLAQESFLTRVKNSLFGNQKQTEKEETKIMKIGIISGSVREGNNATAVSQWVLDFANNRNDEGVEYELVPLSDYDLPLMGAKLFEDRAEAAGAAIKAWSEKMASFDGYVFITPEYNHAVGGALKNALDYLNPEVNNKAAALVGYGSLGGARAHENMRVILGELSVASVHTTTNFSLMADFENMSVFKPNDYNKTNAEGMFNDLLLWTKALNTIR
ncbi:NAD(P)H-dependent oxidoreductase [Desemzia sp. RIT804]|nr:NAD(P)H-dependent oxidoreductase [Desemzia sp. RIT 804]